MPNRNSLKGPRARRFKGPQSNKKTKLLVKFSYIIPIFRDSEFFFYTLTKTINIMHYQALGLCVFVNRYLGLSNLS